MAPSPRGSAEPTSRTLRLQDRDYNVVMLPTAPVPFGGALLCVPTEHVKPAGCSFDGVVNVFMSMGASAPDILGGEPREIDTHPPTQPENG